MNDTWLWSHRTQVFDLVDWVDRTGSTLRGRLKAAIIGNGFHARFMHCVELDTHIVVS